ncbi:MAG: thioredoxin [Prevotellaceae bacterium]|jgi:thioredoxin|nr:thioredoxin [Prevotellaceae bacterium]
MKKSLIFICFLLFFVSCGNKKTNNQNEKVMTIIHLTQDDFLKKVANIYTQNEWKYLGDKPCVIDFYADWCQPCKILAPHLEALAEEYSGQLYIYKINVDKEQELAEMFGIQSIPTLLFVPMTEQPQMAAGLLSKEDLKNVIDEVVLKK